MKTIKTSGSESTQKNSQVDINIQIIDSRTNQQLSSIEEKTDDYWEIVEERFEQLQDEVLDLFTDQICSILYGTYPLDIIDEEISEEEIGGYIDENYDGLKEQLIDLVRDSL